MDLRWLKPLLGRPAPFTTVYLDVTPSAGSSESDVLDRWRGVRRALERDGAGIEVLDAIADLVTRPDGVRGRHGRIVIADAEGVRVDRVLSEAPAESIGVHGPVPALMPAVRSADEAVAWVLVQVDRRGADLTWHGEDGSHEHPAQEAVEGEHDELHKSREGGLARRGQTRAEDSWHRNAETVAAALDARVAERSPELVVLTGDVRAVALVKDAVGQQVRERLVHVEGGARGEGANPAMVQARAAEEVEAFRARRRAGVLDAFRTGLGRGDGAVTAIADVVEVLRRGQVAELVLHEDAAGPGSRLAEQTLWVGPDPLQIAQTHAELDAIGVGDGARELRADMALVRAAIGQDAGLTVAQDGTVELVDGVGAVLRWHDESTPSEAVPTQSADQARLRRVL